MIKPRRFLVVWGVVQPPLGRWNLHRVGPRVAELAQIMLAVGHWFLDVLHHDIIFPWYKVVVDATGGFGGPLVVPVHALVVSCNDRGQLIKHISSLYD